MLNLKDIHTDMNIDSLTLIDIAIQQAIYHLQSLNPDAKTANIIDLLDQAQQQLNGLLSY